MTEQEIKELQEKYEDLCAKASESQRMTCKLTGERESAKTELYNSLTKIFEENSKYHCRICDGTLELKTEPYTDYSLSYYMYCNKCKTRSPLTHDGLIALLEWFRMCNEDKKI